MKLLPEFKNFMVKETIFPMSSGGKTYQIIKLM